MVTSHHRHTAKRFSDALCQHYVFLRCVCNVMMEV